jgi:hypothetical protein
MAELIGQHKCGRLPADVQANRGSYGVIRRRIFLVTRKSKQPDKEKDGKPNFHTCSSFNFFPQACEQKKTGAEDLRVRL